MHNIIRQTITWICISCLVLAVWFTRQRDNLGRWTAHVAFGGNLCEPGTQTKWNQWTETQTVYEFWQQPVEWVKRDETVRNGTDNGRTRTKRQNKRSSALHALYARKTWYNERSRRKSSITVRSGVVHILSFFFRTHTWRSPPFVQEYGSRMHA